MRDAASFLARQPELFAPPKITAGDYLRMRREAAGLTIAGAARFFWRDEEHRETVEGQFRLFELPTVISKDVAICDFPRAFPFSVEIYEQLAAGEQPRLCRICAWDAWSAQVDINGDDRTWSEEQPEICTYCEQSAGRSRRAA